MRKLGGNHANFFLFFLVLLLLFVLAETVLSFRSQGLAEGVFYRLDPLLGWSLRPDTGGEYKQEGGLRVDINSHGFRDKQRLIEKPKEVFRVAVLGDSFVEAMQIGLEETFPALIEKSLWRCPAIAGLIPEVLNFGVKGYGTAQELLLYRHQARLYSPHVVLLVVFPGNDIYNNHPLLNPTNPELAPYFEINPSKGLVLRPAFSEPEMLYEPLRYWLRKIPSELSRHSEIFRLLEGAFRPLLPCDAVCTERLQIAKRYGSAYHDSLIWSAPKDETLAEAWIVTESLIVEFHKQVKRDSSQFLLVLASNSIQAHPSKALQQEFLRRFSLSSLNYASDRLYNFAVSRGIPVVSLISPLAKEAKQKGKPLYGFSDLTPGFGDLNQEGHAAIGALLAEEICRVLTKRNF